MPRIPRFSRLRAAPIREFVVQFGDGFLHGSIYAKGYLCLIIL